MMVGFAAWMAGALVLCLAIVKWPFGDLWMEAGAVQYGYPPGSPKRRRRRLCQAGLVVGLALVIFGSLGMGREGVERERARQARLPHCPTCRQILPD